MDEADRTTFTRSSALLGALAGSLVLLTLAGCHGSQKIDYARPEPTAITEGPVLDIQVFRNVTTIELTNTTARSFKDATIWLNQRFSMPVGDIDIGESLDLPLSRFVDEFGDTFRAGGFFATRDPDPVVLAQLETEGTLYGLVVGGNRIK
ncbi:MAG: hypothetical protein H6810_11230 [Phycisphaeraceae bacterium]|nr:MAG: hypothetical protein H6810_11230 [Phycisphaeraceae bacterium]